MSKYTPLYIKVYNDRPNINSIGPVKLFHLKPCVMTPKFFYLYLLAGTVTLALVIYQLATAPQPVSAVTVLLYLIPALLLYYMAYKVYHVKKDNELM